jgi:ABC-type microcin C transport system duplicated ATPase subunit YejF
MTALLELDGVNYRYHSSAELALTDISLQVQPGRSLGIVGESGSGKSTMLSLLLGLTAPAAGVVRVQGTALNRRDRTQLRALRRLVQPVFQDPYSSLDPRQRVDRIIGEPLRSLRIEPSADRREEAVRGALADVGLDVRALQRYPHQFSGGQRQRIAIARALVSSPRVLLADEPVSALDVSTRIEVIELLDNLARTRDMTIVMVSHDFSTVAALCAELVVLRDGAVVEAGPTLEVIAAPRDDYTRRLVEAIPRVRR